MPYTPPQHEDAGAAAAAQSAAEAAASAAATAEADAQTAIGNAATALSAAQSADSNASTAQSMADSAQSAADSAAADASNAMVAAMSAASLAQAALAMGNLTMAHLAVGHDGYFVGVQGSGYFDVEGANAVAWTAQAYDTGSYVTKDGATWKANSPASEADVPGESGAWDQFNVYLDMEAYTSNNNIETLVLLEELAGVTLLDFGYMLYTNDWPADLLAKLPDLTELDLSGSYNLTSIDEELLEGLLTLDVSYCSSLSELPELPDGLTNLNCGNTNFALPDPLPSSLQYLYCESVSVTTLPTLPAGLLSLHVNYCTGLEELPDPLPTSLQSLAAGTLNITELPDLPNSLQQLYLEGTALQSLPTLPEALTSLNINNTQLSSTDIDDALLGLAENGQSGGTVECYYCNAPGPVGYNAIVTLVATLGWTVNFPYPPEWAAETVFADGDFCMHDGKMWKANADTTGDEPGGEGVTVWDDTGVL